MKPRAEWDLIEHQHKYLINKDDLIATTCLLSHVQYPRIVRADAEAYLRNTEQFNRLFHRE